MCTFRVTISPVSLSFFFNDTAPSVIYTLSLHDALPIYTFVAPGVDKWQQPSRLVLLLPHGYEGQGPEHSSARLERYLQLCAENNMQVCYPTSPAQYFHLLRRQVKQETARPLVVMTPKSLLRLPAATSTVEELTRGGFRPVIDDAEIEDRAAVQRIVLCSGKVCYEL